MQWIFWVIAIIISAGAAIWVYRADKRRAVPYPVLTSLLRGMVVFFTLLLILVPTIIITKNVEEKPIILLLQDNSRSIATALGVDSGTYHKNLEDLSSRLAAKYKVVKWAFGNAVQNDSLYNYHQSATDISSALARAQEYYGMQNLGAVVLASDGRYNQGMNPLYQSLSLHSPVYTVAIGDSSRVKDMRIARAYANKTVTINSSFEVRADLVADLCKGFNNTVTIKEGDEMVGSTPVSVNFDKYDRSLSFTIKAEKAGLHHYVITVPDVDGETNISNNRKDIFVEVVDEKKKILIVSAAPHPDVNAIRDALAMLQSYKVFIATPDNIPASLSEYNVIIAHGLPSVRNKAEQIFSSHKPTWFIITNQTDINALNKQQSLTRTNLIPSAPHDLLGAYNPSFNTFILPQNIQSVTDKMPPLTTSLSNAYPAPGAAILFKQRGGEGLMPVWELQQGSVPTAMLFGEGIWHWRLYEFKNFNGHNVIDECIRQTVSFLAASTSQRPFTVVLPRHVWSDQDPISMSAYLLNANNEQINSPDVTLTIADSAGRKQEYSFERSGSSYSLNLGIWAGGMYTYTARTKYNDKELVATGSFVVESMPLEFMESGADYPLLYGLAQKYKGGFVPARNVSSLYDSISANTHITPILQTNTETVPLVDRKWYFFIILLLAVGEWLLRKYWLAQ